jgi:phage repressor protein C with HTH and peptisase S24 domain
MSSGNIMEFEKNAEKVGLRLKTVRLRLHKGSQAQFASEFGLEQTTLSKYEKGTLNVPDSLKLKLGEFGINLHWFLTGEGEMFLASVSSPNVQETTKQETASESVAGTGHKRLPVYRESELPVGAFVVPLLDQRLSAGNGSYLPEKDEAKALIHVPAYLAHYGDKIKALEVDGDSMYPTLHRGDMVVCDSCGWSGEGVYAVRMNGKGFVKRVTQKPGKVVLLSDNQKYPPLEEPEESQDIEIIGRVHCAITKVE